MRKGTTDIGLDQFTCPLNPDLLLKSPKTAIWAQLCVMLGNLQVNDGTEERKNLHPQIQAQRTVMRPVQMMERAPKGIPPIQTNDDVGVETIDMDGISIEGVCRHRALGPEP
jgi:hypothetical protein